MEFHGAIDQNMRHWSRDIDITDKVLKILLMKTTDGSQPELKSKQILQIDKGKPIKKP